MPLPKRPPPKLRPLGKAFITINENGGSQPFEVFINTAKAGSDTAAVSEARKHSDAAVKLAKTQLAADVEAAKTINLKIDPALERYITSHKHKMDLRGPVFVTVRSKIIE